MEQKVITIKERRKREVREIESLTFQQLTRIRKRKYDIREVLGMMK